MHGLSIDIAGKLARDVGFARKIEEFGAIGGKKRIVVRCGGEGVRKPYRLTPRGAFKASAVGLCGSEEISRVGLRRLPAIERIAVMDHQELDLVGVEADGKPDRRRETAQERGRRRGRDLMALEPLPPVRSLTRATVWHARR